MVKVAIPVFIDRVSPRLDCARRLLVLKIDRERLVEKAELDISQWQPEEKITRMNHLGINQIICGGIRQQDRAGLTRCGIQVASSIYGEVDSIIGDYLQGRLKGCCCQNRKRKGRERKCL